MVRAERVEHAAVRVVLEEEPGDLEVRLADVGPHVGVLPPLVAWGLRFGEGSDSLVRGDLVAQGEDAGAGGGREARITVQRLCEDGGEADEDAVAGEGVVVGAAERGREWGGGERG